MKKSFEYTLQRARLISKALNGWSLDAYMAYINPCIPWRFDQCIMSIKQNHTYLWSQLVEMSLTKYSRHPIPFTCYINKHKCGCANIVSSSNRRRHMLPKIYIGRVKIHLIFDLITIRPLYKEEYTSHIYLTTISPIYMQKLN